MKNDSLISPVRKKRLEVQGYCEFTYPELTGYKFGIRLAYYVCGSIVALGLLLANVKILGVALMLAFLGMFPPYHPIDYLYNYVVRFVFNKPRIPPRSNQGRFACAIATVMVAGIISLFYFGLNFWGYVVGAVLISSATLVSTMDICIPSIIYNYLFNKKHEQERIQRQSLQ